MEGCLAVVTHICFIPEARDAEGLQQVAATEQQDAKLWKREERSSEVGAQGPEQEPAPHHFEGWLCSSARKLCCGKDFSALTRP